MTNLYTGVKREYYDKEQTIIKSEVFVCNGKEEGEYKSYHYNGQLWEIYNNIDEKRQGEYKSYYSNGQLCGICNYIDGKLKGEYKLYHDNGQLKEICNYIDDKRQR